MWQEFLKQSSVLVASEIIISIVVCILVFFLVSLHFNHQKYAHLPGPPLDSFIMGHIPSILKATKAGGFFASCLLNMTKVYGKTFRIVLFNNTLIVTSDPETIKEVLVTGNHPKDDYSYKALASLFGERFVGNGLVTSTDKKAWVKKRAFMNPCFQKSYLRQLVDEFNYCGDSLMNHLVKLADGKTKIRMLDKFNHVSLDLLCKVAFGMEVSSITDGESEFNNAILTCFKGFMDKARNPFFHWNPANWKSVWKTRQAVKLLRRTGTKILKDRREKVARGDYVPDDILTYLIKMEDNIQEIDHEEILDEFVTFFVAGQETTANLLAFMVLCIGQNLDIMQRLQNEITSTVGEKPILTFEDLNRFRYLDIVIKETLRLHPPVPQTFRHIEKECVLDGLRIPAGSTIFISTYISSHLPDAFEDPFKFDPERFNDGSERVNPYTYFPFAIGPRTCIGKHFAEAEAKIIMIKLLQRFNIELDKNQDFGTVAYTTNRPKDGTICTLTLKDA